MEIKRFEIWLADINPSIVTEPGKVRPVVVVQTDLINDIHPSTIICPISSNVIKDSTILRIHLTNKQLDKASDILVDQIRAIDNKRFIKKLGKLTKQQIHQLKASCQILLDI